MTREEAIKALRLERGIEINGNAVRVAEFLQGLDVAISALRPVSQEQAEKVWRGCSWCNNEGKSPENWECSLLDDRGFSVVVGDEVVCTNAEFCPVCGKPLTDKAVEMMMERLEALKDEAD